MAHNITERDGLFVVREPAWHGLGTVLDDYPTRQQAQEIAHPWEPVTQPLFRRVITVTDAGPAERFEEIDESVEVVRSDDSHHLGVVSKGYQVVTNTELYDIAEALQGENQEVRFETGGSLLGGSKVWLLLRLNEPLQVKGDPRGDTIMYYALQNSHDGSGSLRGQATGTRIVCDNTSRMADLDASQRGTEFVFRHTSSVKERIEEAKLALAGWREGIRNWSLQMQDLLDVRLDAKQVDWFIQTYIPAPPAGAKVSDRVIKNVDTARQQFRDVLVSDTMPEAIRGTAYGMLQASVEWRQHSRATRAATVEGRMENRFRRAYLEPSLYTSSAIEVAREAALV
jgi:phage/plasmid-like protein (TIGR03299 family)